MFAILIRQRDRFPRFCPLASVDPSKGGWTLATVVETASEASAIVRRVKDAHARTEAEALEVARSLHSAHVADAKRIVRNKRDGKRGKIGKELRSVEETEQARAMRPKGSKALARAEYVDETPLPESWEGTGGNAEGFALPSLYRKPPEVHGPIEPTRKVSKPKVSKPKVSKPKVSKPKVLGAVNATEPVVADVARVKAARGFAG